MSSGEGSAARRSDGKALRTVALIAFMVCALAFYFVLLGRIAFKLITSGDLAAIGLGLGVVLLPILGAWIVWSSLRAAFDHQRLARRIAEDGRDLDVSELPRRPSGRIERAAADELFLQVQAECSADPEDWRNWYRLARAYDHAGDRSRARETMRHAVDLEHRESK